MDWDFELCVEIALLLAAIVFLFLRRQSQPRGSTRSDGEALDDGWVLVEHPPSNPTVATLTNKHLLEFEGNISLVETLNLSLDSSNPSLEGILRFTNLKTLHVTR
jgi:hypothetical protein